jgi:prephenate dehydratase
MNKQDRQGVRTAPDLERKYKFQDMSDVAKTANSAQMAATNAQAVANDAAAEAASAKALAESIANGLSVVDGLLCITYEG